MERGPLSLFAVVLFGPPALTTDTLFEWSSGIVFSYRNTVLERGPLYFCCRLILPMLTTDTLFECTFGIVFSYRECSIGKRPTVFLLSSYFAHADYGYFVRVYFRYSFLLQGMQYWKEAHCIFAVILLCSSGLQV